jgi:hypothetical protein
MIGKSKNLQTTPINPDYFNRFGFFVSLRRVSSRLNLTTQGG